MVMGRNKEKKTKKNPFLLSVANLDDEDEEEATLSAMFEQFKGHIKADRARRLRKEMLGIGEGQEGQEDAGEEEMPSEEDDEAEDDEGADDGVDMATRSSWGKHKSRYYVGGDEKDYEPEELAAAIKEAEKFDPPRSDDGVAWLGNFYPALSRHRAKGGGDSDEEDEDHWSLHSSDLEWTDTEADAPEEAPASTTPQSLSTAQGGQVLGPVSDSEEESITGNDSPDEAPTEVERRPITREMEDNRGLVPKRKKSLKNPRVKHRIKFKKALIKQRSRVAPVRREMKRYSGEANGIRCGMLKSLKFSR